MIPNPWMIIGAICVAISLFFYGHHKGWVERDQEMQIEIANKNDEARTKEQELNQKLNDQSSQLKETNNVLDQKQSALDRAIRSGRMRLPAPSCVQTSASTAVASGNSNQATSQPNGTVDATTDSERATLAAIAQIVADGDRATSQLNACIDAYNQVRETINGQR